MHIVLYIIGKYVGMVGIVVGSSNDVELQKMRLVVYQPHEKKEVGRHSCNIPIAMSRLFCYISHCVRHHEQ